MRGKLGEDACFAHFMLLLGNGDWISVSAPSSQRLLGSSQLEQHVEQRRYSMRDSRQQGAGRTLCDGHPVQSTGSRLQGAATDMIAEARSLYRSHWKRRKPGGSWLVWVSCRDFESRILITESKCARLIATHNKATREKNGTRL